MQATDSKLTNLQHELLKLFSVEIDEQELIEIKDVLAQYFAKRVTKEADRIWDERGYTDETINKLLHDKHQ